MWWNMCLVPFESWELICSLYQVDWRNLMKQLVTVCAQLLWGGRYGCNNGRYGCPIVMSYIEINKAVSQWLLTFNLCISLTWPLTCAFHIPCTHTPEIIDMHRGVCDKNISRLDIFAITYMILIELKYHGDCLNNFDDETGVSVTICSSYYLYILFSNINPRVIKFVCNGLGLFNTHCHIVATLIRTFYNFRV